jgi:uncharacterized protein YndB with AHSA1/START domain
VKLDLKLSESTVITAPREIVWGFVTDPHHWLAWNARVKQVRRDRRGPVADGERFGAVFQLDGSSGDSQVEVSRCEPPGRLVLRQHYEWKRRPREIGIAISLTTVADGCRVVLETDLSRTGTPWLVRLLVWWVGRFGRPVGPSPLEELKRLAEAARPSLAA